MENLGGDSFNKTKGSLSKQRQFCRNRLECFKNQCWTALCGVGKLMEVDRQTMGPNGHISLFGKIFSNIKLFVKYLVIYHIF